MKKLLPIFLTIGLNACTQTNPKENNYVKTYSGVVQIVKEYPDQNCDILLKDSYRWIIGVNLNDCKNINVKDKILIIEKVKDGLVEVKVYKLNPNLP